jgi:hypothetical protein
MNAETESKGMDRNSVKPDRADDADDQNATQAGNLVSLGHEAEFFHTPAREAFAAIKVADHREVHPVMGYNFRLWLWHGYYKKFKKSPGSQAMQGALGVFASQATFDGSEMPVFVRLAEHLGSIYLDLGDKEWRTVEITRAGWRVIDNSPVRFVRKKGMLALPMPVRGGSVDELRQFVNVPEDSAWILVKAFMLGCLNPKSNYPILGVNGEHGSAKSTLSKMVRAIIDPNSAPSRSAPREERDLVIAAANGWMLVFDNLSVIPGPLSDALCRLATGGGFSTRTLFTDDDERLFEATRPIMFNGIEEVANRPDLMDRLILVTLPSILPSKRRPEDELWKGFNAAQPRILGAFLDAASQALRNLPSISLANYPRMADFAKWVVAGEDALDIASGAFMSAYTGNREAANDLAIEGAIVGPPLLRLMQCETRWNGTAEELLAELADRIVDEKTRTHPEWPKNPKAMASALRRLAPNLRQAGLKVDLPDTNKRVGKERKRIIILERMAK